MPFTSMAELPGHYPQHWRLSALSCSSFFFQLTITLQHTGKLIQEIFATAF